MQPVMSPSRPRPTAWIVATCVLAAVAMALAATVAVLVSDGDSDDVGASAESSARAACDVISQVPDEGFEIAPDDADKYPPDLARLGVAEALAMLADSQGDGYEDLYEAVRKPRGVSNATFDAESDEFVDALADARDACSDEGF